MACASWPLPSAINLPSLIYSLAICSAIVTIDSVTFTEEWFICFLTELINEAAYKFRDCFISSGIERRLYFANNVLEIAPISFWFCFNSDLLIVFKADTFSWFFPWSVEPYWFKRFAYSSLIEIESSDSNHWIAFSNAFFSSCWRWDWTAPSNSLLKWSTLDSRILPSDSK